MFDDIILSLYYHKGEGGSAQSDTNVQRIVKEDVLDDLDRGRREADANSAKPAAKQPLSSLSSFVAECYQCEQTNVKQ